MSSIDEQAKISLILAFIERIEKLNVGIDPLIMAEGFDKPVKTLIEEWVEDTKLYSEHNEYGLALEVILENLYEVDFRIDDSTARLAFEAIYSFEPLNQTWIQIVNKLSKNQLGENPSIVIEQTSAKELVVDQPTQSQNAATKAIENTDIVFSIDGTTLLHSFHDKVNVWDVKNAELYYQVSGRLLGISHKGNTFQTTVGVWDIVKGNEIETPLEFHDWDKRLRVLGYPNNKNEYYLEIVDTSGIREPVLIYIGQDGEFAGHVKAWDVIDPNGRFVAVSLYISVMGHDLDRINCYDLNNGEEVHHFVDDYEISFSGIHNLMFAKKDKGASLKVYNLLTNQKIELEKSSQNIDGDTVRLHPKKSGYAAAINKKRNSVFFGEIAHPSHRRLIRPTDGDVLNICFNPNGTQLAASLSDGQICVWNLENRQLIQRLVAN